MKTTLRTDITVKAICDGFVYNELEGKGLFGLSGKLTIQPEYQRNYIYADGKRWIIYWYKKYLKTIGILKKVSYICKSKLKTSNIHKSL